MARGRERLTAAARTSDSGDNVGASRLVVSLHSTDRPDHGFGVFGIPVHCRSTSSILRIPLRTVSYLVGVHNGVGRRPGAINGRVSRPPRPKRLSWGG